MSAAQILVVDDEDQVRRALGRLLERAGYEGALAADAVEATRRLAEQPFELVLCDVNMPGESGLDLAGRILREYRDTAVVMVTARDDPAIAEAALDDGAYGYLIKPVRPNELLINVSNALRRRRLELESRRAREHLISTLRDRTEELWGAILRIERADEMVRGGVEETIRRLSVAAEFRDDETARHLERMSRYAALIARRLGFEDRGETLRLAARMHDVGKIGVPDRILWKRGPLTDEDWVLMRAHAEIGHQILDGSDSTILQTAATIARTHHERWDGAGYPRGLGGDDIPIEGRIAAVADVFDALTSTRVYRPAFTLDETIQILRKDRGTHFDPTILEVFMDGLDEAIVISERYADGSSKDRQAALDLPG